MYVLSQKTESFSFFLGFSCSLKKHCHYFLKNKEPVQEVEIFSFFLFCSSKESSIPKIGGQRLIEVLLLSGVRLVAKQAASMILGWLEGESPSCIILAPSLPLGPIGHRAWMRADSNRPLQPTMMRVSVHADQYFVK